MPDDSIGLFLYLHTPDGQIDYGSGWRYIQAQARSKDGLKAGGWLGEIIALLNAGLDEKVINLTDERWCICRPRLYPRLLSVDSRERTVYYAEIAIYSTNKF